MANGIQLDPKQSRRRFGRNMQASMSTYFPRGTQYFYSYPAGEASGFLNLVEPVAEELVAARSLSCAGPDVAVVSFASTAAPEMDGDLLEALDIPQIDDSLLTLLPKDIGINSHGRQRNEAIMEALTQSVEPGSLIMAQPFTDQKVADLYQIPPSLTIWLNDKANMSQYIDEGLMPARFAQFRSGAEFAADQNLISRNDYLPCVVKVSSSSSGDGVYICHTTLDFQHAQSELSLIDGTIFIEQFVTPITNVAVHFGIPFDSTKPIDVLGVNEQVTTEDGEFLGGIISGDELSPALKLAKEQIENDILPKIRSMQWYGIGGFDVIVDAAGRPYIIDCNFRMTGMSAYHFLIANGQISDRMISFNGQFEGDRYAFEQAILKYAGKTSQDKVMQMIAVSRHDNQWNFNGALMYDTQKNRDQLIQTILDSGVTAPALEKIKNSTF